MPGAEPEAAEQAAALRGKGGESAARVAAGVEFAPLSVPLARRRQTFACLVVVLLIPGSYALLLACLYYWRVAWPFLVPYLTWALYWDKSPWRGGMRVSQSLRRHSLWKNWAEYFPASLIRANPSSEIGGDGTRPIIIGYHPHGIMSFGAMINFGTDVTGSRTSLRAPPGLLVGPVTCSNTGRLTVTTYTPNLRAGDMSARPEDGRRSFRASPRAFAP